ncbi:hypothetical protein COOONC_13992, partial [Cooperia oncophora]
GTYTTKEKRRTTTSKKDVRHCSCHLVVRFNADGTVIVKGCLGHVGHELDPALLRFTSRQIMYLKNLLEEHSMDYIIDRLRKEDPTKSSKLSFVVKSDLHNIVRRFNMTPGWRHNDDHFDGVAMWTAERCQEFVSSNSDFDIDTAHDRREARYQKLSDIKSTYAAVEAAASSLAELDSNEALTQLEKISSFLKLAARSCAAFFNQHDRSSGIACKGWKTADEEDSALPAGKIEETKKARERFT